FSPTLDSRIVIIEEQAIILPKTFTKQNPINQHNDKDNKSSRALRAWPGRPILKTPPTRLYKQSRLVHLLHQLGNNLLPPSKTPNEEKEIGGRKNNSVYCHNAYQEAPHLFIHTIH